MPHRPSLSRTLLRHGLALALVAAAGALRLWPLQALGPRLAWLTFYPAVMGAALFGGLAAGLLATALSCLAVAFCWPLVGAQPFLTGSADFLGMAVFILTGAMLSGAAEAMLRARAKAAASALALADREKFIRTLTDSMPGMIGYWDRGLRCRFANRAYQAWFGKSPEELLGLTLRELMGDPGYGIVLPRAEAALRGERQEFERTLTRADGSVGQVLVNFIPDRGGDGELRGFSVQTVDVTTLKRAEAQLKLADSVFRNTLEGIVVTDGNLLILSVNPAFTEITGYTQEEVLGRTPRILKSNHHDPAFYAAMWRDINTTGHWQGEIWNRRKGGEVYLEWMTITKLRGEDGAPQSYVSVFHDITERRHDDDRIRHLAFHDALTDLANRPLLMNRLDHQLAKAERDHGTLAVLFMDLDGFKAVNDSLGHAFGDELLKGVAQRLQPLVRHTDTVARLGGDEFVILLDSPANEEEVVAIAGRVIARINEPMAIRGRTAEVGVSVGIALFPEAGRTPEDLIKHADLAMYEAKTSGKNTWRIFR